MKKNKISLEEAFGTLVEKQLKLGLEYKMKQILTWPITEEERNEFRKIKNDPKKLKKLQNKIADIRVAALNSLKLKNKFRKYPLLLGKYLARYGKAIQRGIVLFSRIDADGIMRDYYGFPINMNIDERRKYLMGSIAKDDFAKLVIGLKTPIERSSYISLCNKRQEYIIKRGLELRKQSKNLTNKPEKIIQDELINNPCFQWGGKILSLNSIKQIIYRRKSM